MPEPQDFALQPFEGKARPLEPPRMLDEEGMDDTYPTAGVPSPVAEAEVGRRKKRNTARLVWDSKPKRAPNPKNLGFQIAEVVVPNPAQAGPRLQLSAAAPPIAWVHAKPPLRRRRASCGGVCCSRHHVGKERGNR